jgi:hypothetical protein
MTLRRLGDFGRKHARAAAHKRKQIAVTILIGVESELKLLRKPMSSIQPIIVRMPMASTPTMAHDPIDGAERDGSRRFNRCLIAWTPTIF